METKQKQQKEIIWKSLKNVWRKYVGCMFNVHIIMCAEAEEVKKNFHEIE